MRVALFAILLILAGCGFPETFKDNGRYIIDSANQADKFVGYAMDALDCSNIILARENLKEAREDLKVTARCAEVNQFGIGEPETRERYEREAAWTNADQAKKDVEGQGGIVQLMLYLLAGLLGERTLKALGIQIIPKGMIPLVLGKVFSYAGRAMPQGKDKKKET